MTMFDAVALENCDASLHSEYMLQLQLIPRFMLSIYVLIHCLELECNEPHSGALTLRALNDAKSAFVGIEFTKDFFEEFSLSSSLRQFSCKVIVKVPMPLDHFQLSCSTLLTDVFYCLFGWLKTTLQ